MTPHIVFRPLPAWTDPAHPQPTSHSFTATWSDTLDLLRREVSMIVPSFTAVPVVLQVQASDHWMRRDGSIRADAKVTGHGVVVSFDSVHGPLRYACDRFLGASWRGLPGWQANVRAIALGLEALRKVDRYGIATRGEQYTGWSALPAGRPMDAPMSETVALEVLRRLAGMTSGPDWDDRAGIDAAFRAAAKATHPDLGGDPADFLRVKAAHDFLTA